jgi:hypothetical protein
MDRSCRSPNDETVLNDQPDEPIPNATIVVIARNESEWRLQTLNACQCVFFCLSLFNEDCAVFEQTDLKRGINGWGDNQSMTTA